MVSEIEYYGYIYLTTNKKNGMKYVGQKTGKFNPNYIGSGYYQWKDIRESGYTRQDMDVEVLEYVYSREEITKKENEWIRKLNAIKESKFYNAVYGGNHPNVIKHSEETKAKLRDIHSNIIVLNKDGHERRVKKDSSEANELIAMGWKRGLARKLDNPTKGKFGKDNPHYGMKRSDTARKNMSNAMKGRIPWNKGIQNISAKGSRHMTNPKTNDHKMVRPEDVEHYLELGYRFGRK